MTWTTFIIPTIGRPSLANTLGSLAEQTSEEWDAIVVGDGATMIPIPYQDQERWEGKVEFINAEKSASAGLTRDYGIEYALEAEKTEWIAFVDDDDQLMPTYLEALHDATRRYPAADVVLFRMLYNNGRVLPEPTDNFSSPQAILRWGHVGISFAVHSALLRKFPSLRFGREDLTRPGPEGNEDIRFLLQARNHCGAGVHIDDSVQYLVRPV
jgi:glycosyltransferase involved in cell wall biosynthesis